MAIYLPTGRRNKVVSAVVALAAVSVLPVQQAIKAHEQELKRQERQAFAQEAWAKFKKLCESEAGERIYKTFRNVKSVYVAKALPPATEKDLYDQYWRGDPYSNATPHDQRAESMALGLTWREAQLKYGVRGEGYKFVESQVDSKKYGMGLRKIFYDGYEEKVTPTDIVVSRFEVSLEDESTDEQRRHWIARSRLTIRDRSSNSIVAERIGYMIEPGFGSGAGHRRPWLAGRGPRSTCPEAHDYSNRWFIFKVLRPAGYPTDAIN